MRKIPTVYRRNPDDRRFVIPEVEADCDWVLAGEGKATRKYDGVCVLFDPELDPALASAVPALHGWWARREVKPGTEPPADFVEAQHDEVTGKCVGWEPAEASGFAKYLAQAVDQLRDGPEVGSHELIGPKVNRNPEHVPQHTLIRHADADPLDAPRTFEALRRWLPTQPYEGVVWHHPDGRMAKIKRRDVRG